MAPSDLGVQGAGNDGTAPGDIIADSYGPTFGSDQTPTSAFTGNELDFEVDIIDGDGVTNASVEYWQGTGQHKSIALMRIMGDAFDGTYSASITPYGSVASIKYVFYATDTSNNTNQTSVASITLQDNQPPMIDDYTPWWGDPTTGDPFQFVANVTDDVGVTEVRILYSIGTPPWIEENTTMEPLFLTARGGTYAYNITVPSNTTEPIVYIIRVTDTSNNVNQVLNGINIMDDDIPEVGNNTSDTAGTTGDPITLMVDASDNVGIGAVYANYWFGALPAKNETMTPMTVDAGGNGTYQLVVNAPSDFVGTMSYRFHVEDSSGNSNGTTTVDLDVTDDDPPTVGPDGSHLVGDDTFVFDVNVSDNVGITQVWVVYTFLGQSPVNSTLDPISVDAKGNGTYGDLEVAVPTDQQVRIDYDLWARDAAGHFRSIQGYFESLDLSPPEFGEDGTWGEPVKGWQMALWVEVWDDIGLENVTLEYWFGDGIHEVEAMVDEGGDTYNLTISIPRTPDGDLNYIFNAEDEKGNVNGTEQKTLVLVNVAPEITGLEVWDVTEGTVDVLDLGPYLTDGNDPHASLSISVDLEDVTVERLRLQVTYDVWIPDQEITVNVTDGEDNTTFTLTIHVINVNDDPVFTSEPGTTADVGVAYTYTATYTDEDVSDTYYFALDESPIGMTVSGNGQVDWTPADWQVGPASVDLALFDGTVYIHQTWTIDVAGPVNDPPTFTNSPVLEHTSGTTYTWDADATDPDGSTLTFELLSGPTGATMDSATGLLQWEPPTNKRDTEDDFAFEVRVSDGVFDVDLDFTVHLTYIQNQAPVIGEGITVGKVKDQARIDLSGYMSDPDDPNEDLYWTVEEEEDIFVADIDGHSLVIYAVPGSKGTGKLNLTLHDPWGLTDSFTTQVAVDNPAQNGDDDGSALSSYWWVIVVVIVVLVVLVFFLRSRGGPKAGPARMDVSTETETAVTSDEGGAPAEPGYEERYSTPEVPEESAEELLDELLDDLPSD